MNKLTTLAAVVLATTTFGGAVAFAEGTDNFAMVDGNKDKVVSFDEARGSYPTLSQQVFDQADANKDGTLDESEFGSLQGLTANTEGNNNDSSNNASSNGGGNASSNGGGSSSAN